jgi:hypothetical protein
VVKMTSMFCKRACAACDQACVGRGSGQVACCGEAGGADGGLPLRAQQYGAPSAARVL